MKKISLGYALLFLVSIEANAKTPSEYDTLYNKCVDSSGPINNGVVDACSGEVSEKAKNEINRHYKAFYARLLKENVDDAKKFEVSQKAWLLYRNNHCDLTGAYIGSPMYGFCPMNLNSARALELRQLDAE